MGRREERPRSVRADLDNNYAGTQRETVGHMCLSLRSFEGAGGGRVSDCFLDCRVLKRALSKRHLAHNHDPRSGYTCVMRERDEIMREVSGEDVYAIPMGRRVLEVLLDIRDQNEEILVLLKSGEQKSP